MNNLLRTDSYKQTHHVQYPPGTEIVHSYMESRGGMFKRTLQFGLQPILKKLSGKFFNRQDILDAEQICEQHFGNDKLFNKAGWEYLLQRHQGRLPLHIKAIREGSLVETGNALITVQNSDPNVGWLTNWAESFILKAWYPITVATLAYEIRQVIGRALALTGTVSDLPFKLHDFGYRGASSDESAAIGGSAHLVNFKGTDNMVALAMIHEHYDGPFEPLVSGFSIPASEHSTITSWGGPEHEADAMKNMLDKYPTGLVACVSDSYDLNNAVMNIWGDKLRDQVISRQGTLVIRPDSGEPLPGILSTFAGLWDRFGGQTNDKGYKVLAPCVRVIQGDGVNFHSINQIVKGITDAGWSMDNLAFGMGGKLLQGVDRDTQRFAFKASAIRINGTWHDVSKNPKTDPSKASKAGRFIVSKASGKYVTFPSVDESELDLTGELKTVFLNGELVSRTTFKEVRTLASSFDTFTI